MTISPEHRNYFFDSVLTYEDNDLCKLLEISVRSHVKWAMARLRSMWQRNIPISSVDIHDARQYLKDWAENSENLELLRTLHFQSRVNE